MGISGTRTRKDVLVDTVKQAIVGIFGSMALSSCLTDPNIVRVPVVQEEPTDEDGQGDDGIAMLGPIGPIAPGWDLPADAWHAAKWLGPRSPAPLRGPTTEPVALWVPPSWARAGRLGVPRGGSGSSPPGRRRLS